MRRRALAGAAVAITVAAALALLLGSGSKNGSAQDGTSADVDTAEVTRRTLAERVIAEGTIGYAGNETVVDRLTGTITALPRVGETIRRGERLFGVDGEPVVLMYGRVPAYRELSEGVEDGPDVRQLEQNLAALGYDPGAVDEEFTYATATAVSAWQDDEGLEETGEVPLGRVAFLPGPRRVAKVDATLGEAVGSGGGAGSPAAGSPRDAAAQPVSFVSTGNDGTGPGEEPVEQDEEAGADSPPENEDRQTAKPKGKPEATGGGGGRDPAANGKAPQAASKEATPEPSAEPQASPSQAPQAAPESGGEQGGAPSTPLLETTSTRRIVAVELEPNEQSLARRGQRVKVTLPGGREAGGRVERIEAIEQSGEGGATPGAEGETSAAVEVTVALTSKTRIPALDGAAVSVVFTDRVRRDVLSVPLTALLSIGGGRFAVVTREGEKTRRIEVEPGLAADGYVEVSGKGLRKGMLVEVPA